MSAIRDNLTSCRDWSRGKSWGDASVVLGLDFIPLLLIFNKYILWIFGASEIFQFVFLAFGTFGLLILPCLSSFPSWARIKPYRSETQQSKLSWEMKSREASRTGAGRQRSPGQCWDLWRKGRREEGHWTQSHGRRKQSESFRILPQALLLSCSRKEGRQYFYSPVI